MSTVHDANNDLANIFLSMAELLKNSEGNPYRIRAYQRAADTIADLKDPIGELTRQGELQTLPGIGKDLAKKIQEFVETGTIKAYEELKIPLPPAMRQWIALPGLSEPIVHDLYYRLGIQTLDDLEAMARSHMLRTRPGVGATADELIAAIQQLREDATSD